MTRHVESVVAANKTNRICIRQFCKSYRESAKKRDSCAPSAGVAYAAVLAPVDDTSAL